jgi:hypothetical protein
MDAVHVDVDGRVVVDDVGWRNHLAVPDDAAECADQIPQFDLLDRLHRGLGAARRQVVGQTRHPLLPNAAPFVQHAGGIAVLLVHQQPLD